MLWQARLHPNTKLDRLSESELKHLYKLVRGITDTAIGLGANVDKFPSDWLIPHRKTDKICPHCGSPLTERSLSGSATVYCPVDQPAPNPARRG